MYLDVSLASFGINVTIENWVKKINGFNQQPKKELSSMN